MEVIEFPGYIEEEKLEIATRYLIPRQIEENGVDGLGLTFEPDALRRIIREYSRSCSCASSASTPCRSSGRSSRPRNTGA
jgi:ATP-dependent Lon protease